MIKAQHNWSADKIFRIYIFRMLKKHFASVTLFGKLPESDPLLPTLLIPNHNTWWDGFFVYFLNETVAKQKIYLMMLEEQLKKYPFFSQVGAYGIEPANPKGALTSLKYTLELLEQPTTPKSMVCIFPQGELQPWNPCTLKFKPGIEWLIRKLKNPVNLIPLAIRTEFLEDQLPELFFMTGENQVIDHTTFKGLNWLEQTSKNLLLDIQKAITEKQNGEILLKGKLSIQKKFDRFTFK